MAKKLSIALATYNEEENLARCLDSIKDIADEIIIVDGTSIDKTVEIAKKYKAKVTVTTNPKNFHINKQKAIDQATGDWILQLDADETISPELKEEIKEIIGNLKLEIGNSVNGYWIPRKNRFLGRFLVKGGQYPDYSLRLYKRGKGKLPQKDVHEHAVVEGKTGYLKGAMLHYPYKNFSHYLKKWNSYNSFFAGQIKEEEKKKNIFQKLISFFNYLLIKPVFWFLLTYFRHKGFMDLWQGFVFSFFSALRFPVSYIKFLGFYRVSFIIILIIGAVLRLYNFEGRIGIGGDAGRDAMIAAEALKRGELPLMGPFSSAGPFVFGPLFYWFIMLSYVLLFGFTYAPWIATFTIGILTIYVFFKIGQELGGGRLALIAAFFAAFSPQQINRSLMLGPHTFVAISSSLVILFFLILNRTKKLKYAFLLGLSLGIAVNMHYQVINLLLFFPAILLLPLRLKDKAIGLFLAIVGFVVPSVALIYWDSQQNFANFNNILDYLLIGQYRIYVPNSWKLFLFKDFPSYWSFVVGGDKILALVVFVASFAYFYIGLVLKKINRPLAILGFMFSFLVVLNRYYHGERSEGYMLYFMPFIIIFTSILIKFFVDKKRLAYFGYAIIVLILILSLKTIYPTLVTGNNSVNLNNISSALAKKYPNKKFHFYDYKYLLSDNSVTLSFFFNSQGKTDLNGVPIGVGCFNKHCPKNFPLITIYPNSPIYNLSKVDLSKNKKIWIGVNQEDLYDDLMIWQRGKKLKSTFSLKNYIMERGWD